MTGKLTHTQVWHIAPSHEALTRTGSSKLQRTEELGFVWRYDAGAIVELSPGGNVMLPGGVLGRLSDDCRAIPCDGKPGVPARFPPVDQSNKARKAVAK
jgi:hypothetical protein